MSILGALIRSKPQHLTTLAVRLSAMPGVDLALNPGDGRMVVVLEDIAEASATAAQSLAVITGWPEVLSTSLVYEYSGPDAPAPADMQDVNFRSWRDSLAQIQSKSGLGQADLAGTAATPAPIPR